MSYFKAIMHQIRFRLGLAPFPLGELTALPRPPSRINGTYTSTGRGGMQGRRKEREKREEEGGQKNKGRGEREGEDR